MKNKKYLKQLMKQRHIKGINIIVLKHYCIFCDKDGNNIDFINFVTESRQDILRTI